MTAAIRIAGIAVLAIAGVLTAGLSSLGRLFTAADRTPPDHGRPGFPAGVTLWILAYTGFTTITDQGADLEEPQRNIGRSTIIASGLCTVLHPLTNVAVTGSLTVPQIVEARDHALAEAAEPLSGSWGVAPTVVIAAVATLSGLVAGLFSVPKLYDMLSDMGQAPGPPGHQSLCVTAGPAIVLDTALLVPVVALKAVSDPITVVVTAVVAGLIVVAQFVVVRRRAGSPGHGGPAGRPGPQR